MSSLSPPPGFVLRDPEANMMRRVLVVTILVALVFTVVAVLVGSGWAAVAGAAVIGALALASRESLASMIKWNPPQLEVSAFPYALGSEPTIVYHRRPKRPTDIADSTVECRLTCQESATYTRGTDTVTDSRKVVEQDCSAAGEGTADGLRAEILMPISGYAGAPTFDLGNNEVSWSVEVRAKGAGLPRDKHTFVIAVGPELDHSLRARVQDS